MSHKNIKRRSFITSSAAFTVLALTRNAFSQCHAPTGISDLDLRQSEIDLVTPHDYGEYLRNGNKCGFAAFDRLEKTFEKVLAEIKATKVTDIHTPKIWYLYNMGVVIKTPKSVFGIDIHHRRADELVPLLDFALITHNHGDHWRRSFYKKMDAAGKTVVSNFLDNPGAKTKSGNVSEMSKTLQFGDVKVIVGRCDHNALLVDFTSTYEIHVGKYTIYHTGDCCSHKKLSVTRQPDIWILHPYCGLDPAKASIEKIHPKQVVLAHLQELGHAKGMWRWTFTDGIKRKKVLEAKGVKAIMPMWGECIV